MASLASPALADPANLAPAVAPLYVDALRAPGQAWASVANKITKRKARAASVDDGEDEDGDDEEREARVEREATEVAVAVKAKTFDVVLGSTDTAALDFRRAKVTATLLFEATGLPVERMTVEPLECDGCTPSKDGSRATIEVRVNVLSSQLEGALFQLRFTACPRQDPQVIFETVSCPVRTVSKKSQIETAGQVKKRTRTTQAATRDAVLDMITKMDEQMATSHAMMRELAAHNAQQAQLVTRLMERLEEGGCHHQSRRRRREVDVDEEESTSTSHAPLGVEDAFNALLEALDKTKDSGTHAARLAALGRKLQAEQWTLLAPLFDHQQAMPPADDVLVVDTRMALSGSLNALFGGL